MKNKNYISFLSIFTIFILFSGILAQFLTSDSFQASSQFDRAPKKELSEPVLNLVLIWHQHQPSYKDPETDIYEQPWVFMHGVNSYPYMADILNDYPDVNVTINLTPSMLQQLNDYIDGVAYDRRIETALMDPSSPEFSYENESLILSYFFDINEQFRQNYSRYWELSQKSQQYVNMEEKVDAFTASEIRDLQTLFFAHWINPRYADDNVDLSQILWYDENQYGGYSESQKDNIINYGYSLLNDTITYHKEAADRGQLEIITTPFYHPILPLLIDVENGRRTDPSTSDLPLPQLSTGWTEDALAQIQMGKNYTTEIFGNMPVGMWPSEEAVVDDIIPLVNQSGMEWFVTDYSLLARALNTNELTPEQWFQPYRVEKDGKSSVAFFRHQDLSDRIGFKYGSLDPDAAAADMIALLKGIQENWTGAEDPVFTVALDGENAWEHYAYDIDDDGYTEYTGNLFREAMYAAISQAQTEGWLRTITPKQYLQEHPASTLNTVPLETGSWSGGTLNTWIGEDDENEAWDRLIRTRNDLVDYMETNTLTKEDLPDAWESLYAAEGSDWFWWYGNDQDSGHDELFDWQFKTILRGVYKGIGWTDEDILDTYPELFMRIAPPVQAVFTAKTFPTIDGVQTVSDEWEGGALYEYGSIDGSNMFYRLTSAVDENLDKIHFKIETTNMYNMSNLDDVSIGLYFSKPFAEFKSIFPRVANSSNPNEMIGFEPSTELRIYLNDLANLEIYFMGSEGWELTTNSFTEIVLGDFLEFSIPLNLIQLQKGEQFFVSFLATNDITGLNFDRVPKDGPWAINFPFGGVAMTEVFTISDPAGDEYGTYPTNTEMHPFYNSSETGLMDILQFRLGYIDDTVYFELKFAALFNPWNGPGGYSHPLIQVYINSKNGEGNTECDQAGNFNIDPNNAWEYMVRADGWLQYVIDSTGNTYSGYMTTFSDSLDHLIVFTAPIDIIGMPTEDWTYTIVVGSQDFQNFRQFTENGGEWVFGGGDDSAWDPNLVDVVLPAGYNQTEVLRNYSIADQRYTTIPAVGNAEPPSISGNMSYDLEYSDGLELQINWTAGDNVGINRFEIYSNSTLVDTLDESARSFTLSNLSVGTTEIIVKVFDLSGYSSDLTILINVSEASDEGRRVPGYYGFLVIAIASTSVYMGINRKNILRKNKTF